MSRVERVPMLALAAVLCMCVAPRAGAAQSASSLFQQGVHQEEVVGDLPAAIGLYQRVADEFPGERALAARALVRIGSSYEKMGDRKAQEAYRRVVREFSDQRDAAGEASTRLAALDARVVSRDGVSEHRASGGVVATRLWSTPTDWVYPGAVSPDGREVASVHWLENRPGNTGDLIVTRIAGGEHRVVGETEASTREASTDTYVVGWSWSRDGSRLAYAEWDTTWVHQNVHVVNADGSGDHIISSNNQNVQVRPRDWSQDGSWLVALIQGWDGVARITTISTEDGSVRVLKTLRGGLGFQARHDLSLSLSPDDRFVAYTYPPTAGSNHEVHVLAVDGSSETIVAPSSATERNPLWTSDGDRLVFISDRSGSADLWSVEMSGGEAVGDPQMVRPHLGPAVPLGFVADDTYTYRIEVPDGEQRIVDLDKGAAMFERDAPLTDRFVGYNKYPVFSPDGSRIAYLATRSESALEPKTYLVVKSLADGSEGDIALSDLRIGASGRTQPAWSEDGRSVLLQAAQVDSATGSTIRTAGFRVDVETGQVHVEEHLWSSAAPQQYVNGRQDAALRELGIRIGGSGYPEVINALQGGQESLRDGERVLVIERGSMSWVLQPECDPAATYEGAICYERDAGAYLVKPVVGEPGTATMAGWRLSPDGRRIAYMQRDLQDGRRRLFVRSVTLDDEPRLLDTVPPGCNCPILWTPDGRHLIYATTEGSDDDPSEIHRVAADGGMPERLDWPIEARQLNLLSFDPTSGKAVVPTGRQEVISEVWALTGFPWQETESR